MSYETSSVLANDTSSDSADLTASVDSGALNGSVMMMPDGTFFYTPNVGFSGTDSFTYVAQSSSSSSDSTAATTVTLNVVQAAISLSVTYGAGKTVTVSGTVADAAPGGISVSISGVMSGSALTDSSGNFKCTGTVSSLGTITASLTDQFGVTANESVAVTDPGPLISGLSCSEVAGGWMLSGVVSDPWGVSGLLVTFDGTAAGYYATTNDDGDFEEVLTFKPTGNVVATAQDDWGVSSSPVMLPV
jgi:hypothetical protein